MKGKKKQQDPFEKFFVGDRVNPPFYRLFDTVTNIFNMFLTSILIWTIFVLIYGNNMPIVVVLSDSMFPDFRRGDVLLAYGKKPGDMFPVGEICAYNVHTSPVPIVHRMIETHDIGSQQLILTKGDNNDRPDHWLYGGEQFYFNQYVETGLMAVIPKAGWLSILVKENKICTVIYLAIVIFMAARRF